MISVHVYLRHTAYVLPIVKIWKCYKIKHTIYLVAQKDPSVKHGKGHENEGNNIFDLYIEPKRHECSEEKINTWRLSLRE